jgi:hypothetical protein
VKNCGSFSLKFLEFSSDLKRRKREKEQKNLGKRRVTWDGDESRLTSGSSEGNSRKTESLGKSGKSGSFTRSIR